MATEIIMPKLGLTMTEGTVDVWLKAEGDSVEKGEAVCTISSEKLTHDVEAAASGIVIKIIAAEGEEVPCQSPIGLIGAEEEKEIEQASVPATIASPEVNDTDTKKAVSQSKEVPTKSKRLFITPLAKKIATEKGYDITAIPGTGGNGRITKRDVERYQPSAPSVVSPIETAGAGLSGMRKVIAARMMESIHSTAQVTIHQKANLTQLMAFRKELKEKADISLTSGQLSITTLLAKAVTLALASTPAMNSWYYEGKLEHVPDIHLGIAVAVAEGLVVPVIRNADKMTITQLGENIQDTTEKTRNGTLAGDEFSGSTFTISNLGKQGVEYFTPILNRPETGILGVGSLLFELALDDAGNIMTQQKLPLSLTFDHQVIDGSPAAKFLSEIIYYLEHPYALLL